MDENTAKDNGAFGLKILQKTTYVFTRSVELYSYFVLKNSVRLIELKSISFKT